MASRGRLSVEAFCSNSGSTRSEPRSPSTRRTPPSSPAGTAKEALSGPSTPIASMRESPPTVTGFWPRPRSRRRPPCSMCRTRARHKRDLRAGRRYAGGGHSLGGEVVGIVEPGDLPEHGGEMAAIETRIRRAISSVRSSVAISRPSARYATMTASTAAGKSARRSQSAKRSTSSLGRWRIPWARTCGGRTRSPQSRASVRPSNQRDRSAVLDASRSTVSYIRARRPGFVRSYRAEPDQSSHRSRTTTPDVGPCSSSKEFATA